MTRYRKYSMGSALALAVGLTACGGGGGANLASAPPPVAVAPAPVVVAPPPAPTPTVTIAAAAQAQVPNAALFPEATNGGPTLQAHDATQFPLLETVMKIDPSTATADTATIAGGATITTGGAQNDFSFFVAALGITARLGTSFYYSGLFGRAGQTEISMYLDDSVRTKLSWTTYGDWVISGGPGDPTTRFGSFVTGYRTPLTAVPKTGTASFTGSVAGQVFVPLGIGVSRFLLSGDAALQANFGSGAISGSLTNMRADGLPWNSVSLQGTITSASNAFSGTSATSFAGGGTAILSGAATGTFAGHFFGPSAQELGAVWTLFDGTKTAQGSFGAKAGP